METLNVLEKVNTSGQPVKYGSSIKINPEKLVGTSTKTLYIREGKTNGSLFLSQRGSGDNGAGDICKISESSEIEVNSNLFNRIKIYAEKAEALI